MDADDTLLLGMGCDPNERDIQDLPLLLILREGHYVMAQMLIDRGAIINNAETIHAAAERRKVSGMKLLDVCRRGYKHYRLSQPALSTVYRR